MENNIVYDLLLLEADRIERLKLKKPKLYYEDVTGNVVPLAEPWDASVEDLIQSIFKKKKTRYLITFVESLEVQDGLLPCSHKMLRFMTKEMNYGNVMRNYGLRDIRNATGMNMRYVIKAIGQLCEKDLIRFDVEKGRRTYMVNPVYFYKGSMKSIFSAVRNYDKMIHRTNELQEQYESEE